MWCTDFFSENDFCAGIDELNVVRRSVIDSAISVFTVFMAPSMTKKINTALEKGKTTCPCQKFFSFSFSVHCFHTLFPYIVFPYVASMHTCFPNLCLYIVGMDLLNF